MVLLKISKFVEFLQSLGFKIDESVGYINVSYNYYTIMTIYCDYSITIFVNGLFYADEKQVLDNKYMTGLYMNLYRKVYNYMHEHDILVDHYEF